MNFCFRYLFWRHGPKDDLSPTYTSALTNILRSPASPLRRELGQPVYSKNMLGIVFSGFLSFSSVRLAFL